MEDEICNTRKTITNRRDGYIEMGRLGISWRGRRCRREESECETKTKN